MAKIYKSEKFYSTGPTGLVRQRQRDTKVNLLTTLRRSRWLHRHMLKELSHNNG